MRHDPERLAAAYLDGLGPVRRQRYEAHLLVCDPCWREVSLGRDGRRLAENLREIAPTVVRESIRAAIGAAAATGEPVNPSRPGRRILVSASLAVFVIVAAALGAWAPWRHTSQGALAAASASTVTVAVASFRTDSLPGTTIPAQQAPELSTLGLHLISAAAGNIDGTAVMVFAYRTDAGTRIDLYRSATPIRETGEAEAVGGSERAWQSTMNGVVVICGGNSHTDLLIGTDLDLMRQVAQLLQIT
jgi:hypothetical protein